MSEPKRPGTSKDISELKARLGLKKAAPAQAKNGGQAGVTPPPGVTVPAPRGPVVPNAADDPFGAMNAMASIGTMQRAPEIVIVNDGKPVEHVGAGKRAATIGKYAAIGVVPLIIGVIVGQTAKDANYYNGGIEDARFLLENKQRGIKAIKRSVVDLQTALDNAAKNGFKPDANLTTALDGLVPKLEVEQNIVYRAKQNSMGAELSAQVLGFYSGVAEVRNMLKNHVVLAKADDQALAAANAAGDKTKAQGYLNGFGAYRYGVVITAPTAEGGGGGAFGAKIVELGQPYCADGKQSTSFECPNNNYSGGVTYRNEVGQWTKGEPQTQGSSGDAKKVIPILPNSTADPLMKGAVPGAAEVYYVKRLEALKLRVDDLIKNGNAVETKLSPKAKEDKRFSFFL